MMIIGSVNTYTKSLKLQTQFQMKQAKGELGSHKTLQEYLNAESEDHKGDDQLRSIHQKLQAGAKLTSEERRYLQAKDPEAYSKLEASEREQKAFEQKLRQCRTKEEAQRLKMTYINASLVTVRSVEHNSAIPKAKKLEIMMQEKQRCDKLEQSSREFVRRGDYNRLPTEAEEAKAKKDRAEAEEARRPQNPENFENKTAVKEDTPQKSGDSPNLHVETQEEKKVRRARRNSRSVQQQGADFQQAAAAYQIAAKTEIPSPQRSTFLA